MLKALEKSGELSKKEAADARKKLAESGLPNEMPDHPESELLLSAASLIASVSSNEEREAMVADMLTEFRISEKSAARLRELFADEEGTLNAADMEDLKVVFAALPVEDRERHIFGGVEKGDITPAEAKTLREYLKDVPVSEDPVPALRAMDQMQSREISRKISKTGSAIGMDVEVFRM